MLRAVALLLLVPAVAMAAESGGGKVMVKLDTSKGAIVLELDAAKAPKTVANFVEYVKAGYYDGLIFHRVIKGFMAQGGGVTADYQSKPTRPPIVNEAGNGLKNQRGTIAMARTGEVNSATGQFFINLVDNAFLDHRDDSPAGFGYCVFGKVVKGMDVVDAIAAIPTGPGGPFGSDVPTQAVTITKASVVTAAAKPPAHPASAPKQTS
ncbi:MAG TPA: peptidylprolyl isomerase [Thermoanaerobaculaceae bacterium]|nr:peptidylprolyl isomerase [Thermoanaerobaculaceae bacterium]